MSEGWIKLHRKLLDSDCWACDRTLRVWLWCLIRANHKPRKIPVKRGSGSSWMTIHPGQFVTSLREPDPKLRMGKTALRTCINALEELGQISTKRDRNGTLISVCHWGTYQSENPESDRNPVHHPDRNPVHYPDHHPDRNKNEKNDKNVKEPPITPQGGEIGFSSFFQVWPGRRTHEAKALRAWKQLSRDERQAAIDGLDAIIRTREWKNGCQVAPHTYLRERRWTDEPDRQNTDPEDDQRARAAVPMIVENAKRAWEEQQAARIERERAEAAHAGQNGGAE